MLRRPMNKPFGSIADSSGDREALQSIFCDPDKFAAAPFTFLMASLIVLLFDPGRFSLDGFTEHLFPHNSPAENAAGSK